MQRPWEAFLTLSMVHGMAFPACAAGGGPIVETLTRLATDDFFGAVEIAWIKDAAVRQRVKAIAEQSRLQLGYAAQPTLLGNRLSLNDLDDSGRARAVAAIKGGIDEAAELGCKRLAFLTGPDPGDAQRERGLDGLADSLHQLCAYGADRGVMLILETFDREIDKKSIIGPSALAAEFAARIRADHVNFGLLYDLSHMPLLFEDVQSSLHVLKDYIVHIHVGNGVVHAGLPGYGDLHPRFGFPGGSNDVPELTDFLKGLFDIGYLKEGVTGAKPWVGYEVKPFGDEDPDLILANTRRAWRQAWADLTL